MLIHSIKKARLSFSEQSVNSGETVSDHFNDAVKMVTLGSGWLVTMMVSFGI
jgi:hypothetical protein